MLDLLFATKKKKKNEMKMKVERQGLKANKSETYPDFLPELTEEIMSLHTIISKGGHSFSLGLEVSRNIFLMGLGLGLGWDWIEREVPASKGKCKCKCSLQSPVYPKCS